MAPKSSRRQQFTDEYTEESDSSTMKRRRKDRAREETETDSEPMEPSVGRGWRVLSCADEVDVTEAMEALKKQRDDNLLIIKTEHQMRLDSASKLAAFEEKRVNDFYAVIRAVFLRPCSTRWRS